MEEKNGLQTTDEALTEETNTKSRKRPAQKPKSDLFYNAFGLLIKIGWIALSIFLLLQFVLGIFKNQGTAMEPSFHDRDVILYSRLSGEYEAGDVVVFQGQNEKLRIGRIVGRSGDTVEIDEGGLKLNGYYQTELYTKGETVLFEGGTDFPLTLGMDEYFVLFDNRPQGGDSRVLGKIPVDAIKGRVVLTIRARDF